MPISDSWLKANHKRPRDKVEEKPDGEGLSVRASLTGKLVFQMRYRWEGKPARLDLGTYPMIGVKEARQRLIEMKAEVEEGRDPRLLTKTRAANLATTPSFQEMFMRWYEDVCATEKESADEILRSFSIHVFPAIGAMPADEVPLNTWMNLLDVLKLTVPSITVRILVNAKQMYRWAARRELLPHHSLQNISARHDLRITKGSRGRDLSEDEIRTFFKALKTVNLYPANKIYLRLCLMLGCRNGELRLLDPAEIDFDLGIWTLPPDKNKVVRTKRKTADQVAPLVRPLLPEALELIKEAMSMSRLPNRVFSSSQKPKEMNDRTVLCFPYSIINHAEKRYEPMKHWSLHDLRKTARTNFSRLTDVHVAEKMLGHSLKGMQGVYDYHDYLEEQRAAYRKWFDYLATLT